jgi:hypothetical protein
MVHQRSIHSVERNSFLNSTHPHPMSLFPVHCPRCVRQFSCVVLGSQVHAYLLFVILLIMSVNLTGLKNCVSLPTNRRKMSTWCTLIDCLRVEFQDNVDPSFPAASKDYCLHGGTTNIMSADPCLLQIMSGSKVIDFTDVQSCLLGCTAV